MTGEDVAASGQMRRKEALSLLIGDAVGSTDAAATAAPLSASWSWPSKGVDTYAVADAGAVTFSRPTDWGDKTKTVDVPAGPSIVTGNEQIAQNDVGGYTGRFAWTASATEGAQVTHYAEIAPLTGNLGSTDLGDILETPSVITATSVLTYGFYDSGPGWGGLTNQDQAYVYLTPARSSWMGDLVKSDEAVGRLPFHVFALPGAHDCGMFDLAAVQAILADPSRITWFIKLLSDEIGIAVDVLAKLGSPAILRAVINLAFTQKDTITTMLDLGVRYLDARPGRTLNDSDTRLYHQHNFIPGYPFDSLLTDVVTWLDAHPSEIVVLNLNSQGFNSPSMQPTPEELAEMVSSTVSGAGHDPATFVGGTAALGVTYAELQQGGTRLILLTQTGAATDATKYDSYYLGNYTTKNPADIVAALSAMNATDQATHDYSVAQLQGTASGLGGGIFTAIASMSDASSPLLSTKARFDSVTYPWVTENLVGALGHDHLLVLLNDFCDNVIAGVASAVTSSRAATGFV